MNRWSLASKSQRDSCDAQLQAVFDAVLVIHDCTWVDGRRGMTEQNELYRRGLSRVQWPNSKHNSKNGRLSRAADVAPYNKRDKRINWNNREEFVHFAGIVIGVADQIGVTLRWGGDWDSDRDLDDQTFMDLAHFEMVD